MSSFRTKTSAIHSSLAGDPAFAELVEMFVDEMPARIAWLERHLEQKDWDALARAAHQLKGSAGSYGFHELTATAQHLKLVLAGQVQRKDIQRATRRMIADCRRVTAAPRQEGSGDPSTGCYQGK